MNRRSFLTRVSGAGLMVGAGAVISGCATNPNCSGVTDRDYGRYADRAGCGRGPNAPRAPQRTQQPRSVTDVDPGDPVNGGRGGSRGSCTDSDAPHTNNRTDPAGRGQRCR
ncbi:twin-arginine translocation signal domain-containing protein [Maricaulis parjimensis]|uniref:twin-arginine translocation signal domain-containing protein n=1 Tax=Maricaulis parjimensis TaxID=144023 RepID=UPI001EEE516D|nr:twin-arginine translocation signal domain-containing protein [Maricaulis parjimensis]